MFFVLLIIQNLQGNLIAVKLEKAEGPAKPVKFSETPDSPPIAHRTEVNEKPVLIPTERSDGRDVKFDTKARTKNVFNSDNRSGSSQFVRNSETSDRDRHSSTKSGKDYASEHRRSRWDSLKVKLERPDPTSDRQDADKYSSRRHTPPSDRHESHRSADYHDKSRSSDRYSRDRPQSTDRHVEPIRGLSTDRHAETSRSMDRHHPESSRPTDRHSEGTRSTERPSIYHPQPARFSLSSSKPGVPKPNSVFNRLGDKLPAKQYENINITVDSNIRKLKAVDKSNIPLSNEEMEEMRQDNIDRFGDCSTSNIDSKDLDELKKMRERLSSEIKGWTDKNHEHKVPEAIPQPKVVPPKQVEQVKYVETNHTSTKAELLNASLFTSTNPSNQMKFKESLCDILQSQSELSKANVNTSEVASLVKQAISESATDAIVPSVKPIRSISPTAFLAVQKVMPGKKVPLLANPTHPSAPSRPLMMRNSPEPYQESNHYDIPHIRPHILPDPPQRLALKYNPKPRSGPSRGDSGHSPSTDSLLPNRDPRRQSSFNESPSYGSPTSFTGPLLHTPAHPHAGPNTHNFQSNNPNDYIQRLPPNHMNVPVPSNNFHNFERPHFDQGRTNNRPWAHTDIPDPIPKTYGEYKARKQQQQPKQPTNSSHKPHQTHSSAQSSPASQQDHPVSPNEHRTDSSVGSTTATPVLSKSQFDSIYRVNNYEHSATAVTTLNTEITQNFKIPKKKSADAPSNATAKPPSAAAQTTKPSEPKETVKESASVTRDPRMNRDLRRSHSSDPRKNRFNRIYDAPDSDSESNAETNNADCEVTSSQSTMSPVSKANEPPGKETIEPLLNDLLKSTDKSNLLLILSKVLDDDKKLQQIKRIMEADGNNSNDDSVSITDDMAIPDDISMPNDEDSEVSSMGLEPLMPVPTRKKAKRKNELQKLNEDIRDMFISDGVLTATGRRMCTVLKQSEVTAKTPDNKKVETSVVDDGKLFDCVFLM